MGKAAAGFPVLPLRGPTRRSSAPPVLMFGTHNYAALAVARSLRSLGVETFGLDDRSDSIFNSSRFCRRAFVGPFDPTDPDRTLDAILSTIRTIGERPVLLPMFDERALFVDRFRSVLQAETFLPNPPEGLLPRLYDKRGLFEVCGEVGIATPATVFPRSESEALDAATSMRFPIFVKPRDPDRLAQRTGGRRLGRADSVDELVAVWRDLHDPDIPDLALQEGIDGPTSESWIAAAYFGRGGALRFVGTGRKLRQLPVRGGITSLAETAEAPEVEDALRRLGAHTGFHGVLGADFRFDRRDGAFKLLDINPRLGANWRVFVGQDGHDAVHALYADLVGASAEELVRSVPGRRWVCEDLDFWAVRELSRLGEASLGDWVSALLSADRFAYISRSDLRPAFHAVMGVLRSVMAARFRRTTTRLSSTFNRTASRSVTLDG